MRYLISENRLNNVIEKYLEENFGDLNWTNAYDENGNETDCAAIFYRGDFDDDQTVFRYYDKCWWYAQDSNLSQLMYEKSPLLAFDYSQDYDLLTGFFNDLWKPVFIDWFFKKYRFPINFISK